MELTFVTKNLEYQPQRVFKYSVRGGGGVLQVSSEMDVRRILGGLKFSIPGFFGVGKFGKYFFLVA